MIDFLKKHIIASSIASSIILIICLNFLVLHEINTISEKASSPYVQLVNKKIVVDKDTLIVIDYSVIKDEVILSNGKKVALQYAQLNQVK